MELSVYNIKGEDTGRKVQLNDDIYNSTSQTIDALMKLELPSGVEVEIKL